MRKVLPQRIGMSISIPLLARRFRIPSAHSSRLAVIDGPTISEQFIYLSKISNTTHVSWATRQTEGRAKRETVNMMLIRLILLLQMQRITLLFLYLHIRTEQHSINVPCLMLYQS